MKVFKKILCAALLVSMAVLGAVTASAETAVAVNQENFPDAVFRDYVSRSFDKDGDGSLSETEIRNVKSIYVYNQGIGSLQGIEYFTGISSLQCSFNQLTELDLSQNLSLTSLSCQNNCLTELDVSMLTELTSLDCQNNCLTELDVRNLTKLTYLCCQVNDLGQLDISQNTKLTSLWCSSTGLTELDVSNNSLLRQLVLGDNAIAALDLSGLAGELSYYVAGGNVVPIQVTGDSFDLSALPGFDPAKAGSWQGAVYHSDTNTLTDMDDVFISYVYDCGNGRTMTVVLQPELGKIPVDETHFPDAAFRTYVLETADTDGDGYLSARERNEVSSIQVAYKGITTLQGIEYFNRLSILNCASNRLTELKLGTADLTQLNCGYNRLTGLDLGKQPGLINLTVSANPLESMDLRDYGADIHLTCTNCASLRSVIFREDTEEIYSNAFSNTGLAEIVIPASVGSIGKNAFAGCGELYQITFLGDAPTIDESAFTGVEAAAYYPGENETWTETVLQNYGGDIIWRAGGDHVHSFSPTVTAPGCETEGYTTYACRCGESYAGNHVEPTGHNWNGGVVVTEPTGSTQGVKRYACRICGKEKDEKFSALYASQTAAALPDDLLAYNSTGHTVRQYACEAAGGVYFLQNKTLQLLDLDTGAVRLMYTFTGAGSGYVYEAEDILYWAAEGTVTAYDLSAGAVKGTITLEEETTSYGVGVDGQGRWYLSTTDGDAYYLTLYSPEGVRLDRIETEGAIYEFSGFGENGYAYMVGYHNWYYWGFDHDMKTLLAVEVSDNRFVPVEGNIYMTSLGNLCQIWYYEYQDNAKLLSENLLATKNGAVYDLSGGLDAVGYALSVSREYDEPLSNESYDTNSIGTRMLYDSELNHITAYTNARQILEYDLASGKPVRGFETDHYVFNLLSYGDSIVAIEKENGVYYIQRFGREDMTNLDKEIIDLNQTETYRSHTAEAVKQRWEDAYITSDIPVYETEYSLSPYTAASYTDEMKAAMVEYTNYLRWLGGLTPLESADEATWDMLAKGAVVLSATNELTHEPSQPEDMDDAFYELAYEGCATSNLSGSGITSASQAMSHMIGWLNDTANATSLELGHRFHFLQREGISIAYGSTNGFTAQTVDTYGGQVNTTGTVAGVDNNDYCYTWPGAGAFPTDAINTRALWSINLNSDKIDLSNTAMTVTIRDLDTGEVFDRSETIGSSAYYGFNAYFGYFYGECFYFDPPKADSYEGKRYQVTIDNLQLTNGQPAQITYTVEFCTLEHSFGSWQTITPATTETEGWERGVCSLCGAVSERSIPKLQNTQPGGTGGNPFVDVTEDKYYYSAVLWAYYNGITTGKDATHFNPSGSCTRSQVVTFLWRAAGEPEPQSLENPFPDVPEGKFYTKAVLWAVEQGITNGFKDGTFGPDKACTRGQIVTFLWRYMGQPEPQSLENPFPDVDVDSYCGKAVLWAVEKGITNGFKDGSFGPNKTCTRDQIVAFLYRALAK